MSRELIMSRLFDLLSAPTVVPWKTTSRRLRLWDQVDKGDRPALFLSENSIERIGYQSETLPRKEMTPNVIVYTHAPHDDPDPPAAKLNRILDAIEAAIAPAGRDLLTGKQTLGGLVSHVYISGDVEKDPGDLDGDGILIVPLSILVP